MSSYFAIPVVTETVGPVTRDQPKYLADLGITEVAGTIVDVPPGSPLPFSGPHFFCQVHADEATLDALDANDDVYSVRNADIDRQEVADGLNEKFGVDRSYSEWRRQFRSGRMPGTPLDPGGLARTSLRPLTASEQVQGGGA